MRITVRFFAILKDRAGSDQALLELPAGATVGNATDALGEVFPAIQNDLPRIATAINRNYARRDEVLQDGDELALIPPVSGGCGA
jgi:molybdopterin converting factor subunit 1